MKELTLSKRDLAEKLIIFEGKPLNFTEYFFWPIFWQLEANIPNLDVYRVVLAGRQVGKSTEQSSDLILESLPRDSRSLYIAPMDSQCTAFSTTRLGKMLQSPLLNKALYSKASALIPKENREIDIKTKNDVYQKLFINGSYINLSYADDDPDRVRGYSADQIMLDEGSLISLSTVVPVVSYILRSSKNPRFLLMGTPIGKDELSALYEQSMQVTYVIPCSCGNWQELNTLSVLDVKKKRLQCLKCGKTIDTRLGKFIIKNKRSSMLGMHVNMLMLPSLMDPESKMGNNNWSVIKSTMSSQLVSENQKMEELLGISTGEGTKLITEADLDALPRIPEISGERSLQEVLNYTPSYAHALVMGIDWGGGVVDEEGETSKKYLKSHTAVTVAAVKHTPNGLRMEHHILYHKMYPMENPVDSFNDIFKTIVFLKDRLMFICSDAGGGNFVNPIINDKLMWAGLSHIRFAPIQMMHMTKNSFEAAGTYFKVSRTTMINEYFRKLKMKEVKTYHGNCDRNNLWGNSDANDMALWYEGVLTQVEVITDTGSRIWKRSALIPDDLFFSTMFSYVAGLCVMGMENELARPM